jgi:hypothetical protein
VQQDPPIRVLLGRRKKGCERCVQMSKAIPPVSTTPGSKGTAALFSWLVLKVIWLAIRTLTSGYLHVAPSMDYTIGLGKVLPLCPIVWSLDSWADNTRPVRTWRSARPLSR